jgi:hypothetical protein
VPKPSNKLSTERMRELARSGAETLLKQLRAEIIAVERTFPELALSKGRGAVARTIKTVRKRGQMSAEARKAVSRRMKKYWAERRKAKAKVK